MILVDTDAICAAIKDVFEDTRSILEPAGALAIAGAKAWAVRARGVRDHDLVAIACGANINFDRLRFVAERAEVGEQREAILAVTIPERPGSFKRFCAPARRRATSPSSTTATPTRTRRTSSSASRSQTAPRPRKLVATLKRTACTTLDLTDNEMAKLHVRHLVGGRCRRRRQRNECSTASSFPSAPAR